MGIWFLPSPFRTAYPDGCVFPNQYWKLLNVHSLDMCFYQFFNNFLYLTFFSFQIFLFPTLSTRVQSAIFLIYLKANESRTLVNIKIISSCECQASCCTKHGFSFGSFKKCIDINFVRQGSTSPIRENLVLKQFIKFDPFYSFISYKYFSCTKINFEEYL